jgi:hypothetical protein
MAELGTLTINADTDGIRKAINEAVEAVLPNWQPIQATPPEPMPVLVFTTRKWRDTAGNSVEMGAVRDTAERSEIGFWDGEAWCESGTGHDMFEPWRIDASDTPTHWMPLPEPPSA